MYPKDTKTRRICYFKASEDWPFCSCKNCKADTCPNILDKIPLPGPGPGRGPGASKVRPHGLLGTTKPTPAKGKVRKRKKPLDNKIERLSILEGLNRKEDCACEVVARAIANSTVHKHLGMQGMRSAINTGQEIIPATDESVTLVTENDKT